jgi:hypothetical protein
MSSGKGNSSEKVSFRAYCFYLVKNFILLPILQGCTKNSDHTMVLLGHAKSASIGLRITINQITGQFLSQDFTRSFHMGVHMGVLFSMQLLLVTKDQADP